MKLRSIPSLLCAALAAIGLLSAGGCGGGNSAANVITISISSSSGTNLILGQSTTLTAAVSGATNTNVNWTPVCQYTTTTTDSTGKSTTSKPASCPPDTSVTPQDPNHTLFGVFSNQQTTGTEVFTATSNLPDPKTYPGLVIIATAQSVQDTKRTGTINLTLNSGIGIFFTPATASVPTGENQAFTASLTNDLGSTKGVHWSLTQQIPTTTTGSTPNPYTPLAPCTTCGTLMNADSLTVTYMAPATVPTAITPAQTNNTNSPANVTLVAVSKADPTRYNIGTITIIPSGPITFKGISPTIAPQGATLWDIYLDAPNISSASKIALAYSGGGSVTKDSTSGQVKILFPVPASSSSSSSSTTTCTSTSPCSTGARLRLFSSDLAPPPGCASAQPCAVTVSVTDPNPAVTITQCSGTPLPAGCSAPGVFTYTLIPVRPTVTATSPDDIVLGSQQQSFPVTIDGGYFGPFGPSVPSTNNLTRVYIQSPGNPGNLLSPDQSTSNSRQLHTSLPTNIPTNPGLYSLYVASSATPAPSPNNPAVTNLAIFPDYSATPPTVKAGGIPAGTNPSADGIDPDLGVLVVAETGSNTIEFFTIGSGSLTSLMQVTNTTFANAPINVPTGISVDRVHHTVAVVNYGSQTITTNTDGTCKQATSTGQSVTVLNIPGNPSPITPFHVDLPFNTNVGSATFQASVCPAPMPYSIGVDPDSQLALVAYSSTTVASVNNLGFIVNLNPDSVTNPNSYGCTLDHAIDTSSTKVGQCLYAQVTLNTGVYPQIATAPHNHLALVTPGGSGVIREVDVTRQSSANLITSATLAAGVVTVTVSTKCPNGVNPTSTDKNNPCPLLMVPGNAGTVLIAGLVPGTAANSALFNGVFTVNVTSSNSFTYVVSNAMATDTAGPGTNPPTTPTVFYGTPDQIFGLPATSQGVAINPITNTAAIADGNATGSNGPQINLLSGLDQSVSSISFFATCTAFTTSCSNSPELLATTSVAWQPFTNEVVSYNPKQGLVSISDPVGHKRYAIVSGLGAGAIAFPVSNGTNNSSLMLWGGVAVDPATNQAFVVESGQAANPNAMPPTPAQPGQIQIIDLYPNTSSPIKATHISEIVVPSPAGAPQGSIGGIPNALVPQGTLTCKTPTPPATTCDLSRVKILGSGFASGMHVRLDGQDIGTVGSPVNGGREVDVTIPASFLSAPHHYALDVLLSNGAQSNAVDFLVVQQVDLSNVCPNVTTTNTMPSSVAIADQIADGPFSPFALVSVTGCNSVVVIDLNPASSTFGQRIANPPVTVGTNPQGIAIWQHKGLAVVANNGSNTATVLDLTPLPSNPPKLALTADVSTGTNPTGVAINDATGATIVANTGSNTVTMINLGLLFPQPNASPSTPPTTLTPISIGGIPEPIAVAIDPDRGTSNQGIAVVTTVQPSNGSGSTGALAVVEIGQATPALSTTISSGFVSSTPTGIVFDPAVATNTTNLGVFFANSSGTNSITEFNPDTGGGSTVSVGINPTSLAINPQTGAMLTANSASNTISIVDTISSPFKTRQTLGIPGSPTFGVAIDQFTNLAVIVDQAHQRVLLFPMPN